MDPNKLCVKQVALNQLCWRGVETLEVRTRKREMSIVDGYGVEEYCGITGK